MSSAESPHPGGFDDATSLLVTVALLIAIITGSCSLFMASGSARSA